MAISSYNISNKKAQFAMEYVLVIGVLFLLLVPGIFLYYSYSQSSLEQIGTARFTDIGNAIVNNAENSYFLGKGSKITLDISMPSGIDNLGINCKTDYNPPKYCEITFTQGSNEIVFSTQAPLKIKGKTGYPVSFEPAQYSGGAKKIVIITQEYVELDII